MSRDNHTIVALATPPFNSALAIIRVSGSKTFQIVSEHCLKKLPREANKIQYGWFCSTNHKIIDEVIFTKFIKPYSYTGEDVIEITCHGNMLLVSQIINELVKSGAVQALPGEFTERAFWNQKITLTKGEGINDLINAQSSLSSEIALTALTGQKQVFLKEIYQQLLDVLSLIEVSIDYPDHEEAQGVTNQKLLSKLSSVDDLLQKIINQSKHVKKISNGVNVVLIGKTNVGKSTLLNTLCGESKAITSNIPGTTRDLVEATFTVENFLLRCVDTAGHRSTSGEIEKLGIEKSTKMASQADLLIIVLDGSKKLSETDDKILKKYAHSNKAIVVLNKADIILKDYQFPQQACQVSAKKGQIEPLLIAIKRELSKGIHLTYNHLLGGERQINTMTQIQVNTKVTIEELAAGVSPDLITPELQEALRLFRVLIGTDLDRDLSQNIFRKFCLGK